MNAHVPQRQQIAFPEVGIIRKGAPKMRVKRNGREFWSLGKDLNNMLRVSFAPGTEPIRQVFHELHSTQYKDYGPDAAVRHGYEVPFLKAMIPYKNAFDAWSWASETYDGSGRLIAKAVNGFYVTKRDPTTGEFEVRNGVPEMQYFPGDAVRYQKGDKIIDLVLKPSGRLRLFIPELQRFVNFTLKTGSYYDALRIQENLGAIQMVADMLNGGVAGGIPFYVYRVEEDISYTKKDGSASHSKKWILRLEADPEWVKQAVARMNQFALTGEQVVGLLKPADDIKDVETPSFLQLTAEEAEVAEQVEEGEVLDPAADDFLGEDEQPAQQAEVAPQKVEHPAVRHTVRFDSGPIVKVCAGLWNISMNDALTALKEAHKANQVPELLTLDEAITFAKSK